MGIKGDILDREAQTSVLPFRSYIIGRLILGLGVAFLLHPMGVSDQSILFIAGLLILTSLLSLGFLRRDSGEPISLTGLLLTDVLIETFIILKTGAHQSPFFVLYGFSVLCAGLLLALGGGLSFGILAAGASLGLAWLTPPAKEPMAATAVFPIPITRFALQALFLIGLGLASGSLATLGRRKEKAIIETRQRLKETELEAGTILNHLPWGVITCDETGLIHLMNPAAMKILSIVDHGFTPPYPQRLETLDKYGGGAISDLARRAMEEKREQWCHETEIRLNSEDSARVKPVEIVTAPIGGQGVSRGVVILFQDLTDRKRLETLSRRQDRLAALGRLSAGLAHEMRNSLKPISGSAELLSSMRLPPEASSLMDLILRESETLERFLESYLDMARDKALQIEDVCIDSLIQEELEALQLNPRWHAGITWDVYFIRKIQNVLPVDREQMRRALRNILLNAMEATTKGGIRVTLEERAGPFFRIRIRDWGCGMSREVVDNLFTPLYTTKAEGTGLGLCHARRVIERHGGRLSILSRSGKGTLMTIDLPLSQTEEQAA
ncbi:MAG: PAS domain-containing protein [Candidatus Eisenbacteria bacterium]|nr:PAS domain-containing protein [Candidatus Eisenbacteria bacterium]MBU1948008.1 PAS domain-containing protein [Candidatus Eisenbacteria bacterium]